VADDIRSNCFVFCDFSKAFDKVWHRGLLHKMKAYGITGNLIDWFSSYLKGRRQKVVIKNNLERKIKIFWNATIRENHEFCFVRIK
jgi:hypothetical protein